MKEMKTLKFPNQEEPYEIVDAYAREQIQETLNTAKQYTDTEVAALVNSAPETLDTIGELAAALEENKDMIETLDAAITHKANKTELQEAKEELEDKIVAGLRPPPAVTSYSRPTSIPIISGMQLVFYAACAGTFTLTMGNKTYTHSLTSANDVGWALWVQTGETDGSFIYPTGTRKYLEVGSQVTSANVSFSFDSADYSSPNPNYIIITIE